MYFSIFYTKMWITPEGLEESNTSEPPENTLLCVCIYIYNLYHNIYWINDINKIIT